MHSGDGEEAGNVYQPLPIPREPQTSSASEPREGIVLPSKGGRWVPPSQARPEEREHWEQQPAPVTQPSAGQPWDSPQQPAAYGQQQPYAAPQQPGYPDAQSTQLLSPYDQGQAGAPYGDQYAGYGQGQGYGDADRTQMMAPYGQQPPGAGHDADRTQMMAPYGGSADLVPQGPDVRQPLPAEQQFGAPVPPMPQAAPDGGGPGHGADQGYAPPMPSGAPFAIRPGAPGDQQAAGYEDAAPATQQLPRFEGGWQQAPGGAAPVPVQQPDDYDYLYRKDDAPAPATRARSPQGAPLQPAAAQGGYGYGRPPQQQGYPSGGPQQGHGYDGGGRRSQGKKPSPVLLAGIGVAVLAVVGIAAGAIFSDGSSSTPTGGASASASGGPAAGGSGAAAAQARQLNELLTKSNASRTSVINAVAAIKSCQNLAASSATLRSAAQERDSLVNQLSHMTLNELPHGPELLGELTKAWTSSAAADKDYAAWGDDASKPKGCHKGEARITLNNHRGDAASGRATLAKQNAAKLWNPIAQQYGLTQRQFTQM